MPTLPGNDLKLGTAVDGGKPIMLTQEERSTHLYVCGASGSGKTKFLQNLVQQDIAAWSKRKCGVLLLDWHGSLYDDVMAWMAWNNLDRPVIPIDFRRDDRIVSYNLLRQRANADPAVVVGQIIEAMMHVWGAKGTDQTPRFERWAGNILQTLYANNSTLLEAVYLLDQEGTRLRQAMAGKLDNPDIRRDWDLADNLNRRDFENEISSTVNRFRRFRDNTTLRCMFGQPKVSLDLEAALEEGHIILVNLSREQGRFGREDAELFATLMLNDLWAAARSRGKNKGKPFYIYLDEFQRFVTPTIAESLDEARGFGLHMCMAHQYPTQLLNQGMHGKSLYDSMIVNARNKVVFSLNGDEDLKTMALSLFRGAMNPDKIKHELYSTKVMDYRIEYHKSYGETFSDSHVRSRHGGHVDGAGKGESAEYPVEDKEVAEEPTRISKSQNQFSTDVSGEGEAWSSGSSKSVNESPMLMPIMGKELSQRQYESLDEQLFRAMAILSDQKQRQCVVRLSGMKVPLSLITPDVKESIASPERIERYTTRLLARWPFVLPKIDVLAGLKERETTRPQEILGGSETEPKSARRRLK